MKYFFYLLFALTTISCTKQSSTTDNTNNGGGSTSGNYNFSDLTVTENLVDTIRLFNPALAEPEIYKFIYLSKSKIKFLKNRAYTSANEFTDTLNYNGDNISFLGVQTSLNPNRVIFSYTGLNIDRTYVYDDSYSIPSYRQLGTYITNSPYKMSSIKYRYINSMTQRDSITITMNRNANNDLLGINSNQMVIENSTYQNKLKDCANLKDLRYMLSYRVFNLNGLWGATRNNFNYIDEVTYDVLFNNTYLPNRIQYFFSPTSSTSLYFKYTFNSNGYPISIAASNAASFDPITNEKIQISYYKKP